MVGSTRQDVAHEARARRRAGSAVIRRASSPESPTASGPWTLIAETISRLTLPDQHHAGDVEGLGVGHPQAVVELDLLAEPPHHLADLGPAPVDDHRQDPDRAQQHDVLGEASARRGVASGVGRRSPAQRVAAVLDDDDLARELPDVRAAPRPAGGDRGRVAPRRASLTTWSGSRRCSRSRGRWSARPRPRRRARDRSEISRCRPAMCAATAGVVGGGHPAAHTATPP